MVMLLACSGIGAHTAAGDEDERHDGGGEQEERKKSPSWEEEEEEEKNEGDHINKKKVEEAVGDRHDAGGRGKPNILQRLPQDVVRHITTTFIG